jgi:hypothetical protein
MALQRLRRILRSNCLPLISPWFKERLPKENASVKKSYSFLILIQNLKAFLGVEEELPAAAKERNIKRREISMAIADRFHDAIQEKRAPNASISADGTCMIIEGIEL